MKIRSKQQVLEVMENFQNIFKFDVMGQKHYLFFEEKGTGNIVTIMKYAGGRYTTNRRGPDWVEEGETTTDNDVIFDLIWKNRAAVNHVMDLIKD